MSEDAKSFKNIRTVNRRTLLASGASLAAVSAHNALAGNGEGSSLKWPVAAATSLQNAPRAPFDTFRDYIAALEAHGVHCIGIDDSELVRGLGGPRCMTMPLRRS